MKIGLSFVTLASSAMLVLLSVSAAQARFDKTQAVAAQNRDNKSAALWYPAGASDSNKKSQALAGQLHTQHVTLPRQGKTISGIQPTSPWYAYDAALRAAEHQRQEQAISGIQPTSPWYAYDAALRAAEHQRQEQRVG
jgi:hypothetical protein